MGDDVSPPVGEALADDARERPFRALAVVDSEGDAVVVPEIELGEVAVQVLLAAMLANALHAPLEDRVVALDRARVDVTATLLVGRMPRRTVGLPGFFGPRLA